MSIKLMAEVFDMPLKPNEKLVLLAIADCANDDGYAFPGYKKLMKKTSLAKATLSKYLSILELAGLFTKESHATIGKGRGVNTYQLSFGGADSLKKRLESARKVQSMKSSGIELGEARKVQSMKSSGIEPRKVQTLNPKSSNVEHEPSVLTISSESSEILNPPSGCVSHEIARQKIDLFEKDALSIDDLVGDFGITSINARSWSKVRRTKKAPLTPLAFKKFVNQAEKANLSINDAVELCAEKNWAGFEAEWVTTPYGAQPAPQGNTFGDNL